MHNNSWIEKSKKNKEDLNKFKNLFDQYIKNETPKTENNEIPKMFSAPQLTNNIRVFLDLFELNFLEMNINFYKFNSNQQNHIELLVEQTNNFYLDFTNLDYKHLTINFHDLDGSITKELKFVINSISINTNVKVDKIETLKYKINITF